ncbi:MAG: hypothetical protein JSV80_06610 [Acidobacteriota bacterium]|nr:MAG: hypothetical protein JSV80_06610 [Acidobacteriota bacterium]
MLNVEKLVLRASALLWPLSALHVALAAAAWLRATEYGARRPDTVSFGFALLGSLIAAGMVMAATVFRDDRSATRGVVVAVVALLLIVQGLLHGRFDEARYRYEDELGSGLMWSDDEQWRFGLRVCEPFRPHRFVLLDLMRVADRRRWVRLVPLRRSPRDAIGRAGRWARMTNLGRGRYWLSLSTVLSRRGPQFFVIDTTGEEPVISELRSGFERVDGRAVWDCGRWEDLAASRPSEALGVSQPTAGAVAAELTDLVCGAHGRLAPERSCAMEREAERCTPLLAELVACHPYWAADSPAVTACLERRAESDADPRAWDALLLLALEHGPSQHVDELIERAHARETQKEPRCASHRREARRLLGGVRQRRTGLQHAALVALLDEDPSAAGSGCDGLPQVLGPAGRPQGELIWDLTLIERHGGRLDESCARVRTLLAREHAADLTEPQREDAKRWRRVCEQRDATAR